MKLKCNSCDGLYDSLDIRFTKSCDNSCSFCIEKDGIGSFGQTDVSKLIQGTLISGIKSVLILGGEPFLLPEKLLEYVKGVRNYANSIYITTSLPFTFVSKQNVCNEIIELIDGLNVSVHSINSERNNEIFNASSSHYRLELLCSLNSRFSHKIRTSINLVKGGIDSSKKLNDAISFLEQIGCKRIKLNELQHSYLYVSYEKITGNRMKNPFSNGCQTIIRNDRIKITLKRSCFITEKSNKASISDLVKVLVNKFTATKNTFKVMYENGSFASHWIKDEQC
jgi:molybdenum cofactor biosynthesis enzyme MoaA